MSRTAMNGRGWAKWSGEHEDKKVGDADRARERPLVGYIQTLDRYNTLNASTGVAQGLLRPLGGRGAARHSKRKRFDGVSVLIACKDQAVSVGRVVDDFIGALPGADVWVADLGSLDSSQEVARAHGARVRIDAKSGQVAVRQMIGDIEAKAFVLADASGRYDAQDAVELLERTLWGTADICLSQRYVEDRKAARRVRYNAGIGNDILCRLLKHSYGMDLKDALSGLCAFTKDFADTLPPLSDGFDTGSEMTFYACEERARIDTAWVSYMPPAKGAASKEESDRARKKSRDMLAKFFLKYHPIKPFCLLASLFLLAGMALGAPVWSSALVSGRAFTDETTQAILALPLLVLSALTFSIGFVLDAAAKGPHHAQRV